jgi:D-alanyl-D-alanine carboxypeptidase (penicillin-binding protein 5/6)
VLPASLIRSSLILVVTLLAVLPSRAIETKKKKPAAANKPVAPAPKKADPDRFQNQTDPSPLPPEQPGDSLGLAARGAICINAGTGEVVFEKNADEAFYPASTTKMMTALLVIESGNLDGEVVIQNEDAAVGESSLSVKPGEHIKRRQMLYGLMLKSANDVAHALGRDNAGTMAQFAEKMTVRAKELGCTNSHFTNPHGLHHPDHYASPRDLATIARAAMQNPVFRHLVSSKTAKWSASGGSWTLSNHNRLLEKYPDCNGIKTGYTIPAQQVLVSSASRNGINAIAVVMHTNKPGIWEDSAKLLDLVLGPAPASKSDPKPTPSNSATSSKKTR